MTAVEHLQCHTFHCRKGEVKNTFSYSIDYVLVNVTATMEKPLLFSRNWANVMSLRDCDHGGAPRRGSGLTWVREVLQQFDLSLDGDIILLAQPRMFGHVFNPVSFWFCYTTSNALCVVIAEVSNTFGDRHSYICHHSDLRPIEPRDNLKAKKIFHVSPFQPITGDYTFQFDIGVDDIDIRIDYSTPNGGVLATLRGVRAPMTNRSILAAFLRRPFGSRRVLALIHWQAFKLWCKGARYNERPAPPSREVSR